jgi:hypothetical protein
MEYFIRLIISLLAGFAGGVIGTYIYQHFQRIRDKKRWEEMCKWAETQTEPGLVPGPEPVPDPVIKPVRRRKSSRID